MITTALLLYFLGFGMGIIFQSMGFYFYCVVSIILLTAGINIYYLFNISYLRFSYIKTKIARIMMDYKDNDEIQKELCLKDSQNNWWAGIISVVVFIFILLILSIL